MNGGYASESNLLTIYQFNQAATYTEYERTVYNMLDVLTYLGGLFSSLNIVGLTFTRVFSYNLMLSSIIRKLYHFKPRFESEIKKKKDKKKKKKKKSNEELE